METTNITTPQTRVTIEYHCPREAKHALDTHLYRRALLDLHEDVRAQNCEWKPITRNQVKSILKEEGMPFNDDAAFAKVQQLMLRTFLRMISDTADKSGVSLYE